MHPPSDEPTRTTAPTPSLPADLQGKPLHPEAGETTVGWADSGPPEEGMLRPTVPGYELLGELGRGGMGVVYKAHHLALKRLVALKMILNAEHAGVKERERFRAEAEAVARLQHSNIVQVYEVGEAGGHPFCALELVGGGSLARRLASSPLAPQAAAQLVRTLAEAVHAAHERGVIHRDLKPANVLLAEDGTPKITDFGLAKRIEDSSGLTQTGQLLGTPSYMAPEQAEGRARDIGPATDVYALGAILYECLTGRPPFKGATVLETLEQVRTREPASPRLLQPAVPRDLETITRKCLHKAPGQRYTTAHALSEDLGRLLRGEPIQARPVGGLERAWAWVRRRPALASACALAVLLLVVSTGGGAAAWFWQAAEVERAAAETARQDAVDARLGETEAREQLDQVLYLHRVQLAYREWQDNNILRTRQLLAECPPDRRQWEWAFVDQLARPLRELRGSHPGLLQGVAWSPDGHRLLLRGPFGMWLWDPDTGQEVRALGKTVPPRATADAAPRPAAWSPDGRRIAARTASLGLTLWDPEGHKVADISLATPPTCLAYSPDGQRLAFGFGGSNIRDRRALVCDAVTGKVIFTLTKHAAPVSAVAFSPDGKWLVSAAEDGAIQVWEAANGKEARTLQGHSRVIKGLAFHPDSRRLASGGLDGTVRVWDVAGGKELLARDARGGVVGAVAFSPDGRRLAAGLENGTVVLWDEGGGEAFTLRAHLGDRPQVSGLAFSPDGRRLASSSWDGAAFVWDVTGPQEGRTIEVSPCPLHIFGLAGGGRWLVGNNAANEVLVGDLAEPRQVTTLVGSRLPLVAAACSADGSRVAALDGNGHLRAWGPLGRELWARKAHAFAGSVAIDPAGKLLASGGSGQGRRGEVKVWDLASGELRLDLSGQGQLVTLLAFSPDGTRLASASTDTLRVQDTHSGAVLWACQEPLTASLAFRPDGATLACGDGQGVVTIRETDTGQEVRSLRGHTKSVQGLAFHPDGRRLASGSTDGSVRLWDLSSGQEALVLKSKQPLVAFSAEGHTLFTTGNGGQVRLWRTTTRPEAP